MKTLLKSICLAVAIGCCFGTNLKADTKHSSVEARKLAFNGAEGFGANSKGGQGGKVLKVTRLDDSPDNPKQGSLRWALNQKGPRIVKFDVAGTIILKDRLIVKEPFLTIDGSSAPGQGICIRDYPIELNDTNDIIIKYIRVRRGDVSVLRENKEEDRDRPESSSGLDCISMSDSKNIIVDHCSLSWSCDEILGITRCKNVTIQWCILSEPLSNPAIHPYGDNHAYCINASASTLSVHHCLMAHYVMRGPQFEANDVTPDLGYNVKMEAINNVLFNYEKSGSRYSTGIEEDPEDAEGAKFRFQFIKNYYINSNSSKPEIEVITKHGVLTDNQVRVHFKGNRGPHWSDNTDPLAGVFTDDDEHITDADDDIQDQIANKRLFEAPVPVTINSARKSYDLVLENAGCNLVRDEVDKRIIKDVKNRKFNKVIRSQKDVGSWPELE